MARRTRAESTPAQTEVPTIIGPKRLMPVFASNNPQIRTRPRVRRMAIHVFIAAAVILNPIGIRSSASGTRNPGGPGGPGNLVPAQFCRRRGRLCLRGCGAFCAKTPKLRHFDALWCGAEPNLSIKFAKQFLALVLLNRETSYGTEFRQPK